MTCRPLSLIACALSYAIALPALALDIVPDGSLFGAHTLTTEIMTRAEVQLIDGEAVLQKRSVLGEPVGDRIITFDLSATEMTVTGLRLRTDFKHPKGRYVFPSVYHFEIPVVVPPNEPVKIKVRITEPAPGLRRIEVLNKAMLAVVSTPFFGTAITIPGTFEAEDFDKGGEGVAYHDNVKGNAGGQYRTSEDVDIIVSSDPAGGGYVVTNPETGEWLAYTINVQSAGLYDIEIRASNNNWSPSPRFHVEIDGVDVTGSITVPSTGGWSAFQWVGKKTVALGSGLHILKIVVDQQYFNLNSIRVTATAAP